MRIRLTGRLLLIGCSLMALLLLSGCGGSPVTRQPTPTQNLPSPTATPGPKLTPPPMAGPLGMPPTDCPASPPIQTMTQNNFGGGFSSPISFQGGSPAWQFGLPDDGSPLHVPAGSDPWPSMKVMWVVGPDDTQPVTLTGHDVRAGTPLWFEIYPSNAIPSGSPDWVSTYTTSAVLDPTAPNRGSTNNSTGHWNIWGIGIIVLAAGCYELDVSSSAGGWHAIYPMGQ